MREKKPFIGMWRRLLYCALVLIGLQTFVQAQAAVINVNAGTDPGTVTMGQPTEVVVEAFTPQGVPMPGAHVKISAGGGRFLHSNSTTIHGQTDANGVFRTPWECVQCAPAYIFSIEVTKPGYEKRMAEAKVNIVSQPAQPQPQPQGGQIFVHVKTHPPTVNKGQPTEIFVRAMTSKGQPIPGAQVKISAGGGVFIHSNSLTIHGQTDPAGVFVTPWKCLQCAPAYGFGIEVTKPGFKKGNGKAQVNISSGPILAQPLPKQKPVQPMPQPLPQPQSLPDLAISSIKVYPTQPEAGKKFTVVVYVTNKGGAASGQFDLAMYMKDIGRNQTYPVGTFRRAAMKPGEQIPWQKQDLMVNFPGSYQYWVEIKPFLFKDKDTKNNTAGWGFMVK